MTRFRWWICARDRWCFGHHRAQPGFSWSLSKLKYTYVVYIYICFTCPCFTCPGTHAYPRILTSCHSRGAMARLVEVGSILLVATIALSSLRISLSCVCCICNFGGNLMGGYWMETWKTFQTHRTEWIQGESFMNKIFCTWYVLRLFVAHQRGVHFLIEQPLTSVWNLHIDIMIYHQYAWPCIEVMFVWQPVQKFLTECGARTCFLICANLHGQTM